MQAPSARYRHFLGTYLAPQRTRMAILATLMLIDLALQLGLPRVVQTFIDSATAGGELRTLLWIGVAYLAVTLRQPWTPLIAAFTFAAYVGVYTPLKGRTKLNTLCS